MTEFSFASSEALKRHRVRTGALWFALLCGPIAGLANEQVEYALVAWSCGRLDPVSHVLLHAVPLALIALCVVAGLVAWRERTHPPDAGDEGAVDADRSRRGFMALLGVGLSVGGVLVLLAQWMPVWYLDPCVFA